MGFLKSFKRSNRKTKYRICRNKYGYYKIQEDYWWSFPFVWWPIWEVGTYWVDIKDKSIKDKHGESLKTLVFKTRQEAMEFIKSKKEKIRKNNDEWYCEKKVIN